MMLVYRTAETQEYAVFLQLMQDHAADYLTRTLALLDMTWEDLCDLFRTVGQVQGIYVGGKLAGFCWTEERDEVLHLHGLILKKDCRGQGIGSQVLRDLETRHGDGIQTIELGVHASNQGAKRLYERLGYETVKTLDALGFEVMQKELLPEQQLPYGAERAGVLASGSVNENNMGAPSAGQPLDIKVLYTEGCPGTPGTIERIADVAAGMGIPICIERTLVESPEQALEQRFLGSPTVQVNGLDIDPSARKNTAYGFT